MYDAVELGKTPLKKAVGPVYAELDRLTELLVILENRVDDFEPVLMPVDHDVNKPSEPLAMCDVAARISSASARVINITKRLSNHQL